MKGLLALAALLLTGCTMYRMPAVLSECTTAVGGPLKAAAVIVDITPPIGLSLAGYGLEARISTGLLTHLRCRGFVFEKLPQRFAWLSCELQALPLVLQRRVAELVRAGGTPLGADRIILSAVHTHAAPGHIYDSQAYSTELGGTRQAAYDQRVVDFIAGRIAGAIKKGYDDLQPAHIHTMTSGNDDDLCVEGLTRNRAMLPFSYNKRPDVEYLLPCQTAGGPPQDDGRINVDRRLPVVFISAALDDSPIGVMAVFPIHGTTMPSSNELYHGDVFAFASTYCEQMLPLRLLHKVRPGQGVVCAIANGAEGDVSPDASFQGEAEVRYLGERLGAAVVHRALVAERRPAPDPDRIESRYLEINFPGAMTERGRLRSFAEFGTPGGGGAPDGPTRLRFWEQFNPGMINSDRKDQQLDQTGQVQPDPRIAVLQLGLDETSRAGFEYPVQAPIELLRIGDASFLALPVEPTTMVGLRLAEVVDHALASHPYNEIAYQGYPKVRPRRTHVVGLTNGYASYVTTQEEYQAQFYEGASTLYGSRTELFLEARVEALMKPALAGACGCAPQTPRQAKDWDPPNEWLVSGSHDPNARGDQPGPQPEIGMVNPLYMSPSPVRSRWPEGVQSYDGCYHPGADVTTSRTSIVPRACCDHGAPTLQATWNNKMNMKLCGASVARVLVLDPAGILRPLLVGLRPPSRMDPDVSGTGDATGFEEMVAPGSNVAKAGGGMPVDDEHGLVTVRYLGDDNEEHKERWQARFRYDGGAILPGKGFAFELSAPDGFVITQTISPTSDVCKSPKDTSCDHPG